MSKENNEKLNEQLVRCLLDDKIPNDIRLKKMDYIICLGGAVDAKHETGYSLLSLAKFMGDEEVICLLEKRGARESDLDKKRAEEFFKTASLNDMNKFLRVLPDGYELDCDVDLSCRGLDSLPNFSRVIVNGYFNCSNNELTTLCGAPREIREGKTDDEDIYSIFKSSNFDCRCNKLTSLKGAPIFVKGDFDCTSNELTTLCEAPEEVNGDFNCRSNPLSNITGRPKVIGGEFNTDFYDRYNLTENGFPRKDRWRNWR